MKKVMIIDDSKPVRTQVKSFFTTNGYETLDAANGVEALAALGVKPEICLFVVDVNMPQMNGIDFCTELRQIQEYKETPVFMLTTESSVDIINQAKPLGVKAWILKPFEPGPLKKAIELVGIKKD